MFWLADKNAVESVRRRAAASIGLGGIVAVVVVGTVVVALAAGLLCAWISSRNRRRRHQEVRKLADESHQTQMTSVAMMQDDGGVRHSNAPSNAAATGAPFYSHCSSNSCCSLGSCEDDATSLDGDFEGAGVTWRWRQFWRRQQRWVRRGSDPERRTRCQHEHHHHRAGPRKLQRPRPATIYTGNTSNSPTGDASGRKSGSNSSLDWQEKRIMPPASLDAAATATLPTAPIPTVQRPPPPSDQQRLLPASALQMPANASNNYHTLLRPLQPALVTPGQAVPSSGAPTAIAYQSYRQPAGFQMDRQQQEQQQRQIMMMQQQQMQQMQQLRMQWAQQQQQQRQQNQLEQPYQPTGQSRSGYQPIPSTRLATESALSEILRSTEQRLHQLQSAAAANEATASGGNLHVVNRTNSESNSTTSHEEATTEGASEEDDDNEADHGRISLASASSDADSMCVHESSTRNSLGLLQKQADGSSPSYWESSGGDAGCGSGGLSPSPSVSGSALGGQSGLPSSPSVSTVIVHPTGRATSPTRGLAVGSAGAAAGVLQFPPPAAVLLPQPMMAAAAQMSPDMAPSQSPTSSPSVYSSSSPPPLSLRSSRSSLSTVYSADERAEADAAAAAAAAGGVAEGEKTTSQSSGGELASVDDAAALVLSGLGIAGAHALPGEKKERNNVDTITQDPPSSILVLGDVSPSSRDLVPAALMTPKIRSPSKLPNTSRPAVPVRSNIGVARGPRPQVPLSSSQKPQQPQTQWEQLANSSGGFGGIRDSFGGAYQPNGGGGVSSVLTPSTSPVRPVSLVRCDDKTLAALTGGGPVSTAVAAAAQKQQLQVLQKRLSDALQSSPTLGESDEKKKDVAVPPTTPTPATTLRPLPHPPQVNESPNSVMAMAVALRRMNSTACSEASSCYSNASNGTASTLATETNYQKQHVTPGSSTPTRRARRQARASTIAEDGEGSDYGGETPTPGRKRNSRRHGLAVVGSRQYLSMGTSATTTMTPRQSQALDSGDSSTQDGQDKENNNRSITDRGRVLGTSPTRPGVRSPAKPAGARALTLRRADSAAGDDRRSVKSSSPSPSPAAVRRMNSGSARRSGSHRASKNRNGGSPLRNESLRSTSRKSDGSSTALGGGSSPSGKGAVSRGTAAAAVSAGGLVTPTRNTPVRQPRSRDAQSLYDEDGFLLSTPRSTSRRR